MSTLEELILELPQDLQQEVEDFVHFLLRKHAGTSSQDEADAMKDYCEQYKAKQAAPEPAAFAPIMMIFLGKVYSPLLSSLYHSTAASKVRIFLSSSCKLDGVINRSQPFP